MTRRQRLEQELIDARRRLVIARRRGHEGAVSRALRDLTDVAYSLATCLEWERAERGEEVAA